MNEYFSTRGRGSLPSAAYDERSFRMAWRRRQGLPQQTAAQIESRRWLSAGERLVRMETMGDCGGG